MMNDPFHPEDALERARDSKKLMLLAVACALGLTTTLLLGYAYFRGRHAQEVLLSGTRTEVASDNSPKGPPQVNVVVDEPMLDRGTTILRGSAKNLSTRNLKGVAVTLELKRRKDGTGEEKVIPLTPGELKPDQEGTYSLKLSAQAYSSIRLIAVTAEPQSTQLPYSSSAGKKRPPEKIESRSVVMRPSGRAGEFLNTPDNPARVP